jgi:hypothetical protein
VIDTISNVIFLIDGVLRMSGLYIRLCIESAFNRDVSYVSTTLRSGFIDTTMTILSFAYGLEFLGLWFRIFRLMVLFSVLMDLFPHLDVLLVSGEFCLISP